MRFFPIVQTLRGPAAQPTSDVPCARPAETAQCWQDACGFEGVSLEWMLDRTRAPQEATP
ncbi:hypothetical protein [Roseovarius dicentrarchi]|uniref:hypothetical protein n=1 Tax=Roseovarius dicentrarchi TaxID=2250573 RepID=UPI000DEAB4EE|nr:hypothetical protein [Roseovarius dicentrarchi]